MGAMALTRRRFLASAAAAGGLAVLRPWGALGRTLGPAPAFWASRRSRLFAGTRLVHADLHNHTQLSDGDGDPERAFASMRSAGLDVAALTDHTTIGWGSPVDPCFWGCLDDESIAGIDEDSWNRTRALADRANRDGDFVAIRGFEWSSPFQGHMNVWFSERWMDPLHTGGGTFFEGGAGFFHEEGAPIPPEFVAAYDDAVRALPTTGRNMALFYEWLKAQPSAPGLGGGADGLAGFNHPGREPGRFGYFRRDGDAPANVVAMEIFNRDDDYLFRGLDNGERSPLVDCLNAGWRVGLVGVTDEHGDRWGFEPGKGRTGVWVREFTRDGVKRALRARRVFATREPGLRVDASANGARMGAVLRHRRGPVRFRLDVNRGPDWTGKLLNVQVLRPGDPMPEVARNVRVRVPFRTHPVIAFSAPIDRADGDWIVLRITDPEGPPDERADGAYARFGNAVAYTSPWFLQP